MIEIILIIATIVLLVASHVYLRFRLQSLNEDVLDLMAAAMLVSNIQDEIISTLHSKGILSDDDVKRIIDQE